MTDACKDEGSVLTFVANVSDKHNLSYIKDAFQIMPSTLNFMTDRVINQYVKSSLPLLLIHINYITNVWSDTAIERGSTVRLSLRQYVKLAQLLGTRNILVHLPSSLSEWNRIDIGFKVLKDELLDVGMVAHLEIPAFSKSLEIDIDIYFDTICKYIDAVSGHSGEKSTTDYNQCIYPSNCFLVMDTAHLHANHCGGIAGTIRKYIHRIWYVHLNGNKNMPGKKDYHVPIFHSENKIKQWESVCREIALLKVVCVAEVTHSGKSWEEWTQFASAYGFRVVDKNTAWNI